MGSVGSGVNRISLIMDQHWVRLGWEGGEGRGGEGREGEK